MDRASLVRRRQQIRQKENEPTQINLLALDVAKMSVPKKKKPVKRSGSARSTTSEESQREAKSSLKVVNDDAILVPPPSAPVREKRSTRSSKQSGTTKTNYSSEANAGLVVRQLLQRSQFGDVKEFLLSTTKNELFQQALVVATYVQELKKKHAEVSEAVEEELVRYQSKYRSLASDLAERERRFDEQEQEKNDLLGRLKLSQDEYQSLIAWIREHEDKFKALQQTKQDQAQLIEEMAEVRRQREEQLNTLEGEREQAFRFAEEMQEQNSKLQTQAAMVERDCERLQAELKEEQGANKQLLLEVQQKAQALKNMSSELEDCRSQVSTLHGQVQLEAISRQSVTQERDRLQQQYQLDREDWKSTQEHRDALEKRKADEFRKMDLELRHLNQALSRLRIEWESEKSQREKAEARLHKLSTFIDETKAHTKALEEESQQLKTQLNEEKESRTSKEHALHIARRDLQALQKNCREQESAKLDAQSEVASLVQRMKVIRRDHLALLHRVEAPTQLAAQWHAQMQENQRSRS
ncbi:Hyaluronan mediated motility receptor [Phytophthora cinnamomi]|uniref:Hyaluronan mediated motility receptor n=1 Tax=Phytophthora cinnamomi TaxID=4785 RepID=UPI00355A875C|nr:Hyaluronan mediated motility receptor [Phytophthora cinnamomi]